MLARHQTLLFLILLGCEAGPPTQTVKSLGELKVIVGQERFGVPFRSAICESRNGAEVLTLTSATAILVDGRMQFPDLLRVEVGPGEHLNAMAYLPNAELGGVEYPMAYLVAYPLDEIKPQCEVVREGRARKVTCNAAHIMPWRSAVTRPPSAFMAEFECAY